MSKEAFEHGAYSTDPEQPEPVDGCETCPFVDSERCACGCPFKTKQ